MDTAISGYLLKEGYLGLLQVSRLVIASLSVVDSVFVASSVTWTARIDGRAAEEGMITPQDS